MIEKDYNNNNNTHTLHWQEEVQRALCAPGGKGRKADRDAFEGPHRKRVCVW